ncbi:MAG: hypothetical protein ACLRM9_05890 [Collinsella aerofaciens]
MIGDVTRLSFARRFPCTLWDEITTIAHIDSDDIDCILAMEFIDFTVSEYIRDAAMLGQGKCAIHMGHFNGEEPGMECMAAWLLAAWGCRR